MKMRKHHLVVAAEPHELLHGFLNELFGSLAAGSIMHYVTAGQHTQTVPTQRAADVDTWLFVDESQLDHDWITKLVTELSRDAPLYIASLTLEGCKASCSPSWGHLDALAGEGARILLFQYSEQQFDVIRAMFTRTKGCELQVAEPREPQEIDVNDSLYQQARAIVLSNGAASLSLVQRSLKIGYSQAAKLLEMM